MRPERFRRLRNVLRRRQPDLTVLMERVNKTHNFSAILRNCDAVGILEAHAALPDRPVPVHHDTSGGVGKWMRVHTHPNGADGVRSLQEQGFRVLAAHRDPGAVDYRQVDYTRPVALLVGAELDGVGEAALAASDATVTIPLEGMVRSLNVSVATALLLFEARRQREAAGMYDECRIPPERYRALLFEWCHPRRARECREQGFPYPELDDEGRIIG